MKTFSAIAIYFIIWWLMLIIILPWGVKSAHEAGVEVEEGHDAGAPVRHHLLLKALATTVVASIVFAVVYWVVTKHPFSLNDIPFMPKFRLY